MNNTVIEVNDVSIKYLIGDFRYLSLKDFVIRKITHKLKTEELWANSNISLTLNKGDMLGIIGINGAGKSTLLRAISGVLKPTSGTINTNGNIAALLELTSGFDDELTVKENIYLRGALLGYSKSFINSKYQEIIEFAELNDFENTSYKKLSSGMKSRLAFSIASLVSPDIIILDEVLAVGDGSFKIKSANKIKEILDSGVTGILVSHSLEQIKELCNKVLWLDHGKLITFSDNVDGCLKAYEEFLITKKLPNNI